MFIVSRAFALLLISWALVEITYLPERIFALFHHLSHSSVLATQDYWSRYYEIITISILLRTLAFFLAAVLFWRCGPRVQALFSPEQDNREASGL